MSQILIKPNRLAELLAEAKKKKEAQLEALKPKNVESIESIESTTSTPTITTNAYGQTIEYNAEQNAFIQTALTGNSCILLGAAGTGKTTTMKGVATALVQSGKIPILDSCAHKFLQDGLPGIVFCAYTRRATANLRKNLPADLQGNCITIHKLLEYQPVYYTVSDPETGDEVTKMSFEATRNRINPLPAGIHTIVCEESSMISVELYKEIESACSHPVQFIFLGDIQQLPPVFGSAILGYKMLELPTVELTQVYRQALESPIIRLAHRILSGNIIPEKQYSDWEFPGQLKLHPWKKKIHADIACLTFAKFITLALDHNTYDPESDIILIPFNKAFGTDEINKHIANHIARRDNKPVYEIIAGFNKYYFSIGDKVLFDKEDAQIIDIKRNATYSGASFQSESLTLDYWGHDSAGVKHADMSEDQVDFLLSQVASGDGEDRVRQASHILTLRRYDSNYEFKVETASALNSMSLGYAITVHKSQGSEWRKVFLVFHQSHATMIQRELLYTAVTRAKEELYVICEPESFEKGIKGQRIKGNTLAEKAEFFKGKLDQNGGEY